MWCEHSRPEPCGLFSGVPLVPYDPAQSALPRCSCAASRLSDMISIGLIRDGAEAAQPIQALAHQVDLVIAADLADGHLPVRIGVEERVAGVAAGERLASA